MAWPWPSRTTTGTGTRFTPDLNVRGVSFDVTSAAGGEGACAESRAQSREPARTRGLVDRMELFFPQTEPGRFLSGQPGDHQIPGNTQPPSQFCWGQDSRFFEIHPFRAGQIGRGNDALLLDQLGEIL